MAESSESEKPPQTTRLYQPSFAGGELAPGLWHRSDMAQWRIGLAAALNFIITPQGGAARRAGTEAVGSALAVDATKVRLISFQFSETEQYVVELGQFYARFIQHGQFIKLNGNPLVVATPWAGVDISSLRFVQSADVLTITHPYYQQQDLKRYGATDWRLVPVAIGSQMPAPSNFNVIAKNDQPVTGSPTPASHVFTYAVTAVNPGTADESGLSNQASCANLDLGYYPTYGYRNEMTWTAAAGALYYTVYRLYQGTWSRVGQTASTSFIDTNFVPNTAEGPPQAGNPFVGGNWPGTVGYFQQRKVYGGSFANPETLWFSKSGNFGNFDVAEPVRDDDAITYTLVARQVNQVRHLIPLNDLIVMTSGGGWKVSGGSSGGPITPNSIEVLPQSFVGAADVTPLVMGNRVLYVEARGSSVREIAFQFVQNQYVSEDRSVFSKHLFHGHQIIAWAYAEVPDKIVWAVRDDGALLSLSYLAEQQVLAWTRHETAGLVRSVTVISEDFDGSGQIDVLYLVVQRTTAQGAPTVKIERMQTRRLGSGNADMREAWHLDCASRVDSSASGVRGTRINLPQFNTGQAVSFLADGVPGMAIVDSAGGIPINPPALVIIAGLPFSSVLTMLPAEGAHPGDDPWIGRLKRSYRARVVIENGLRIRASVDGLQVEPLIDPDSGTEPTQMVTDVLETRLGEGWTRQGQLTLRCDTPLPATICGVVQEWMVGE